LKRSAGPGLRDREDAVPPSGLQANATLYPPAKALASVPFCRTPADTLPNLCLIVAVGIFNVRLAVVDRR
jgi:hypothetical protein